MSGGKHGKPARESKDANENGRRRIRETGRRKKIQTQRVAHRLHHPNEPSPLPSAPEPVAGVDHREVVKGADLAELVKLANPAEVVKGANQAVDTIKEAVRRGQWEPVEAQDLKNLIDVLEAFQSVEVAREANKLVQDDSSPEKPPSPTGEEDPKEITPSDGAAGPALDPLVLAAAGVLLLAAGAGVVLPLIAAPAAETIFTNEVVTAALVVNVVAVRIQRN